MHSQNNKKYSGNPHATPKKFTSTQRFSFKPTSTPALKSISKCEALSKLKNEVVRKCPSLTRAQSKPPFNSNMRYEVFLARKRKEAEQKRNGINQLIKAKRDENWAALKGIIPIAKSPPFIKNKLTDCLQQIQEKRSVYDKRAKPYNIMAKIINIISAHDRKFERLESIRMKEARMQRRQRMMKYKNNENKCTYNEYESELFEIPESPITPISKNQEKNSSVSISKVTKNSSTKSLKNGFTKKVLTQKINVSSNHQTFSKFDSEVTFSAEELKDNSLEKKATKSNSVSKVMKCGVLKKKLAPRMISNNQSLSKTNSEEHTKEKKATVPSTLKSPDSKVLPKFYSELILSDENSDDNVNDYISSKQPQYEDSNNNLTTEKTLDDRISDAPIGFDFIKSLQDEIDKISTKIEELESSRPTNHFQGNDLVNKCSLSSLDDLELFELIECIENML